MVVGFPKMGLTIKKNKNLILDWIRSSIECDPTQSPPK